MGYKIEEIEGIGAACLALDMPIVSGNVSLYNETSGEAILPTPTIGAVGLLSSLDQVIGMAPEAGDALVLIGETAQKLEMALAGRVEIHAAASLEKAVDLASSLAGDGDVVLLAPACASQDQFRDFAERGDRLRSAVKSLAREGAAP